MGRHSAPSRTGRNAARIAAAGAVFASPVVVAGTANAAATWDQVKGPIERCESGGRNIPTSVPGPFTASGFWQITNPTWRDHGGGEFASRALFASRAEQEVVAERLFDARGTQPWDASKACWQDKIGREAPRAAPAPAASGGETYVVRRGDTLGAIAAKHHTTVAKLFAANRNVIDNPDRIFPGERIQT
jgi:resuscitation-promoting factor RpfA